MQPTPRSKEAKEESPSHPSYFTSRGHKQTHPKQPRTRAEAVRNNPTSQVALASQELTGQAGRGCSSADRRHPEALLCLFIVCFIYVGMSAEK